MSTINRNDLGARESDVLSACLQWLTLHRVFHWRQNQGAIPIPGGKGYRKFNGMPGLPDILAVLPRKVLVAVGTEGPDIIHPRVIGMFVGIEVKRPGGRVRPAQEAFRERLNILGGLGIIVHSLDELQTHLGPYVRAGEVSR